MPPLTSTARQLGLALCLLVACDQAPPVPPPPVEKEPCDTVACPAGQVCRAGACATIDCGPDQACQGQEQCLAGRCQLPVHAEAQGLVPAAGMPGGNPGAVGAGVGGTARGATHTLLPGAL